MGMKTTYQASGLQLLQGFKYFTTVRAVNRAGLHSTATSDGVVTDNEPPGAGTVFNTKWYHDIQWQSDTTKIYASWTGFHDHHSFIEHYECGLGSHPGLDDIVKFQNAHFQTVCAFESVTLEHAHTYWASVKAYDNAGLVSPIASSGGVTIDQTHPSGFTCEGYQNVKTFPVNSTLKSTLINEMINVSVGSKYYLNVVFQDQNNDFPELVVAVSFLNVLKEIHLIERSDGLREGSAGFFSSTSGSECLKLDVFNANENSVVDISLMKCRQLKESGLHNSNHITISQLGMDKIELNINVEDAESGIKKHTLAIGTRKGGVQVQPFIDIGDVVHSVLSVNATHGMNLTATLISENHAALKTTFTSNPITFDMTPPYVGKIEIALAKLNQQDFYMVEAMWVADDMESGIKSCSICVGKYM